MLYYLLFWAILGFIIHFYIIFGTNLLTGGPSQNCCFFAYFMVSKKRNIRRSQNGTKSTGEVIFGRKATRWTWSARQEIREVLTRVGGAPTPRACPLPRGPPVAPPTYPLHPYIPMYPETSKTEDRSGVPPPQASIATKNLSGARSGTLPEGDPITGGYLHHPGAIHDEEGVVHPRG